MVFVAVVFMILCGCFGCVLQGGESGICLDSDASLKLEMPFCGEVVDYRVCVPQYKGAVVSRWRNHTIFAKDSWIQSQFDDEWEIRKLAETSEELKSEGVDERGIAGNVVQRFYGGSEARDNEDPWYVMNDCAKAYRNLFCWTNFPRCNGEDKSMILCKSVCENYFKSCGYSKDMERCGESQYFNGYEPEKATADKDGLFTVYSRSFFPGQPFRENMFEEDGETPIAICTPSIKNSAQFIRIQPLHFTTILIYTWMMVF